MTFQEPASVKSTALTVSAVLPGASAQNSEIEPPPPKLTETVSFCCISLRLCFLESLS